MSLLYIDGFDHYSDLSGAGNKLDELAPNRWVAGSLTRQDDHQVAAPMPRLGGLGLQLRWQSQNSGTNSPGLAFTLPRIPDVGESWGFGFHFYTDDLPASANAKGLFGFCSGPTDVGTVFTLTSSGQLSYKTTGPSGTIIYTSSGTISPGVLYHFEFKCTFGLGSAGGFEVRVNGVPFFEQAGISFDPANRSHVCFGSTAAASSDANLFHIDNFYIWDDQGGDVVDWLGDRTVFTLLPDSDGAPQDWSLSSGSEAFSLINSVPPSGGFIETGDIDDRAVFGIEDLFQPSHSIVGVQIDVRALKTDAGASEIAFGPTGFLGSPAALTQDQNLYYGEIWERDPGTNAGWTALGINALEVEIEKVA